MDFLMNCIIRRKFLLDKKKKKKENGTIAIFVLFSLFFFHRLPNFFLVINDYINNYFTFDYHVLLFSGFIPLVPSILLQF